MDNTIVSRTGKWKELDSNFESRLSSLKSQYHKLYGESDSLTAICSPGRAEILGNHTDYNEGYTISTNVTQNLIIVGAPRDDNTVQISSQNLGGTTTTFSLGSVDELMSQKSAHGSPDSWTNYVKGVVWSLTKAGIPVTGFNAVLESTIPLGGVSSSAALELAVAHLICTFTNTTVENEKLVALCKNAENNYAGAPCGYLDQATVALADSGWLIISYRKEGDRPFTWYQVSMDLKSSGYSLVVGFDPESKHALVDGKYAVRQKTCFETIPVFQKLLGRQDIKALRDITVEEFEKVKGELEKELSERHVRYAEHIIYDNDRVLRGIEALKQNDVTAFGSLLTKSGSSSLNLYELDEESPELRYLYETIISHAEEWGVAGIRNMGGGFNATTLSLVKSDKVSEYEQNLNELYSEKFGRKYNFIEFTPSPSAGEIQI